MFAPRIRPLLLLSVSTLLVSACGGGGGGGGGSHSRSFEDLTAEYARLQQQAYTGKTSAAMIDEANFVTLARMYLSDEPAVDSQPEDTRTAIRAASRKAFEEIKQVKARTRSATARERIDERQPCGNQEGYVTAKGDYKETETSITANVALQYHNCLTEDGAILNGPAVFFRGGEAQGEAYFYNSLESTEGGVTSTLTGSVTFREDGHVISNMTMKDGVSGLTFQTSNFDEASGGYGLYGPIAIASGRLYHPSLGYVDISASHSRSYPSTVTNGNMLMTGGNNQVATLYFQDYVARTELKVGEAGYVSMATLFESGTYSTVAFMPTEVLGQLPMFGNAYLGNGSQYFSASDDIPVHVDDMVDPDGDEMEISYRWSINGRKVTGEIGNTLLAGSAKKGDNVRVTPILRTGGSVVDLPSMYTTLLDAEPEVIVHDAPTEGTVGETISFNIEYADPDGDSVSSSGTTLVYGPTGAMLAQDGTVTWTPNSLMFGDGQAFHFGFQDSARTSPLKDIKITIHDPLSQLPLVRSIKSETNDYRSGKTIEAVQLDSDPAFELLTVQNNVLSIAEKHDNTLVQEWVYPYNISSKGILIGAAARDIENDGTKEIIVATPDGIHRLHIGDTRPQSIYQSGAAEIKRIIVDDVDSDGTLEAVIQVTITDYSSYPYERYEIRIINLASGTQKLRIALTDNTSRFVLGNVDSDAAKEIVTASGYVYDGNSGANEWVYSEGFGPNLITADLDGNGRAEVVSTNPASEGLRVHDVASKTMRAFEFPVVIGVAAANLDNDIQQELVLISDTWEAPNTLRVVDLSGISPVIQWSRTTTTSYSAYNMELLVADVDKNGNSDLVELNSLSAFVRPLMQNDQNGIATYPLSTANLQNIGYFQQQPGNYKVGFLNSQGILAMSNSGGLDQVSTFTNNFNNYASGIATDFDNDGYSDVFLNNLNFSIVSAYKINDSIPIWSLSDTSNNRSFATGKVLAKDMNGDTFKEAIIMHGNGNAFIVDLVNENTLWNESIGNYYNHDIAVGDLDGDDIDEIVTTSGNTLSVWKKSGVTYTQQTSIARTCNRLEVANVVGNDAREIVCVSTDSWINSGNFFVYSASLMELRNINLGDVIEDITLMPAKNGKQGVIACILRDDNTSSIPNGSHFIVEVSAENGGIVWESPALLGAVSRNNLHAFTDDNNKTRLTFNTPNAIYLTQ